MNNEQIKHMLNRFLGWKLPATFNPDGGISFKRVFNEHTDHPMKYEPSGTNLFDAIQAEAMVRYMVEGLPQELMHTEGWKYQLGDDVVKKSGSQWHGKIVGFYSSSLTERGYAVESNWHRGSVQIYPEAALALDKARFA